MDILNDIIGQRELKQSLKIAIGSALRRKVPLGHFLLSGGGGLGKSHIVNVIAKSLNYRMELTQGDCLGVNEVAQFLIERCGRDNQTSLIFIDEIHAMPSKAQQVLYYPMSDGFVNLPEGKVFLPPFTLVGATTNPDQLNAGSLINRFANHWKLRDLDKAELMAIIYKFFIDNKYSIHGLAMETIALRSRGNPRLALRYAAKVLDYAACAGGSLAEDVHVKQAFDELKVDENGLDEDQRSYLALLGGNENPMGLNSIAKTLGRRPEQVKGMIEPYLWKLGLISSSSRGRELTAKAYLHI